MLDLKDPVVLRFIERLVALSATEWDGIRERSYALASLRVKRIPPPRNPALENFIARTFNILQPTDEALERIAFAMQGWSQRMFQGMLAPRWRRHGTGPIRRLHETLELPYVDRIVRLDVLLLLLTMEHRAREAKRAGVRTWADMLREQYAPFEPVIPWASLVPTMLPGPTARTDST